MQMETITVQKVWPPSKGKSGKMGPAKVVGTDNRRWSVWPRDVDPSKFQEGQEYVCGVEPADVYNGEQQFKIMSVVDGQTRPIPKVLQKPVYRQASAPSERRSIEVQSICKLVPHWFETIDPNDVGALAALINAIGKARDLSTLAKPENVDDMEGDVIGF